VIDSPHTCRNTRHVPRIVIPNCLLSIAPNANARGPNCTLAAPWAREVCNGWVLNTSPQQAQAPLHVVNRVTSGRSGGISSMYWSNFAFIPYTTHQIVLAG
jgi:hypothetical protein